MNPTEPPAGGRDEAVRLGSVVEVLDEADCTRLLASHHFGRLAVLLGGRPAVFPVNYVFDRGRVAIRTRPGELLAAATSADVAFEIDEVDESSRSGWSVMVQGVGYDVTDALDAVSQLIKGFPVDSWAPGEMASWIRIEPDSITGRRLVPG